MRRLILSFCAAALMAGTLAPAGVAASKNNVFYLHNLFSPIHESTSKARQDSWFFQHQKPAPGDVCGYPVDLHVRQQIDFGGAGYDIHERVVLGSDPKGPGSQISVPGTETLSGYEVQHMTEVSPQCPTGKGPGGGGPAPGVHDIRTTFGPKTGCQTVHGIAHLTLTVHGDLLRIEGYFMPYNFTRLMECAAFGDFPSQMAAQGASHILPTEWPLWGQATGRRWERERRAVWINHTPLERSPAHFSYKGSDFTGATVIAVAGELRRHDNLP